VPADDPVNLSHGRQAEDLARRHLGRNGLKFLQSNYRCPFGEIDLVMLDGDTIVFVEVRYRARADFGAPAETVDARKQGRLRATAAHFLQRERWASKKPCRFDIVAVTGAGTDSLRWLQNAF